MSILDIFEGAGRIMTVISFATFIGIVAWAYVLKREQDFAWSAALPFADDAADELEEDYV